MMPVTPRKRFEQLLEDRSGVASIEFVLIAPILLIILLGGFTVFDLFRAASTTEKATFTIADLMSRQASLDRDFLAQMSETFERLAVNDVGEPQLRITSISRTDAGYEVDWVFSSAEDGELASRPTPLEILPAISVDESVILTESIVTVTPLFDFAGKLFARGGLQLEYASTIRPRLVDRIEPTPGV